VTLRQNGGVYWVPAPYADGLRRLQGVVENLGQSKMHLVPITRSKEGQAALAQAAKASIEDELNALQTEVQDFMATPPTPRWKHSTSIGCPYKRPMWT